eukprot:768660-Hanusia_phi.AAC.2
MVKDNKKKAETKTEAKKVATPVKEAPKPKAVAKEEKVELPESQPELNVEESPLNDLTKMLGDLALSVKGIQAKLKMLAKEFEKQQKYINKDKAKREKAKNTKSGFTRPCKISDEMCDFVGIPHGTEMSRTDVTRHINKYVKDHELHNPVNRRVILPDEKLKKLLKVTEKDDVTFFQLQRLISPHFPPPKSAQK